MIVMDGEARRWALRLGAGAKLPDALEELAAERGVGQAYLEGAASLSRVELVDGTRYAAAEASRIVGAIEGGEIVLHV
ncbi:MAG TPA: hypothetical protein RMH26_11745, partial [Polyangiaceae bacterium LLY-WYZ-15_(1-7)]|nr:hypothetical protein [Polyangiaceae bacterium LLY-WYZ-15_(1-7)]